jgi:hypothetical protein
MKHAGEEALAKLAPLLAQIRQAGGLTEKRPGVFYLKSRAALHFHEDPAGLFADVRPAGAADFERLDVTQEVGQTALLSRLGLAAT